MALTEKECCDASESDTEYFDDSDEDPNFDVVEETRLTLSNLSLKRKSKRVKSNGTEDKEDEGELDEQDQKNYEIIRKIVEGGQVNRLKVEECKLYLRKHGLRLSGNKETLIQRIKEHIDIVNGGGEKKYPTSSFVLNCKGDACMGDVVMFEQNVYEEFSVVSRSAKGGPCGTRIVAGRILKESYGAAKQQHTFTIEVLWSKGEKPLPPLCPLLIKGRNLYRLRTMRQKWEDEGERQKILLEKHARGGAARSNREARIQQKEMRKLQKQTSSTRNEHRAEPKQEQQQQNVHCYTTTCEPSITALPINLHGKPNNTSNAHVPPVHQRQPLISKGQHTGPQLSNFYSSKSPNRVSYDEQHMNIFRGQHPLNIFPYSNQYKIPVQRDIFKEHRGFSHENVRPYSQQSRVQNLNAARTAPVEQKGYEQKQKCRYFVQGRCYFGDRCKYVHELSGNN